MLFSPRLSKIYYYEKLLFYNNKCPNQILSGNIFTRIEKREGPTYSLYALRTHKTWQAWGLWAPRGWCRWTCFGGSSREPKPSIPDPTPGHFPDHVPDRCYCYFPDRVPDQDHDQSKLMRWKLLDSSHYERNPTSHTKRSFEGVRSHNAANLSTG